MFFRAVLIAVLLSLSGCVQMTSRYVKGTEYDKAVVLYENGLLFDARRKALSIKKGDPAYRAARKLVLNINAILLQIAKRHMEMGEDYEKAGIYHKAVSEYGLALKYNPSNILVMNKITTLTEMLREGKRPEFERSVIAKNKKYRNNGEDDPDFNANTHYMKGKIYLESKDYARAIEEFTDVLSFVPAYMNTQELLEKSKRERDKEIDMRLKNGIRYFQAEEMDLAIKEWDIVLELDPGNAKAADYRDRAELIMDRLRKIREKKVDMKQPL